MPSTVISVRSASSAGAPASQERRIVIGTRGSALALWQTEWGLERGRMRWPRLECVVEEITTRGDQTQALQVPLTQLGDKSLFVAELERALLTGALDAAVQPMNDRALVDAERAATSGGSKDGGGGESPLDAAVHSLKDLPGRLDSRLVIAAVPEREDPRDALISRSGRRLADLPSGAVIATGSLRRRAQLLHLRPDLQLVHIRGN